MKATAIGVVKEEVHPSCSPTSRKTAAARMVVVPSQSIEARPVNNGVRELGRFSVAKSVRIETEIMGTVSW
jgi:hypothetical protein